MEKPSKSASGTWIVFLAALCWSLNSPCAKYLQMDAFTICALRAAIGGAALLPFLRFRKIQWNLWLLGYVLSFAGLSISLLLALKYTSAAIAVGMQFTSPLWIALLCLIKGEKQSLRSLFPMACILGGVLLFMLGSDGNSTLLGNLIALSEGIFFSGLTITGRRIGDQNTLGVVALASLFTAVAAFLIHPASLSTVPAIQGREWAILAVMGIVQMAGGYSLYTIGTKMTTPQKAALMAPWEMILGPIWVALIVGEIPGTASIAALVIIFIGLVVQILLDQSKLDMKKLWTNRPHPQKHSS